MISIMVILLFTQKRIYSSMHQYNKTYCSHQTFFQLAHVGRQRQGLSYTEVTIIISQRGLQNATDCIFIDRLMRNRIKPIYIDSILVELLILTFIV